MAKKIMKNHMKNIFYAYLKKSFISDNHPLLVNNLGHPNKKVQKEGDIECYQGQMQVIDRLIDI